MTQPRSKMVSMRLSAEEATLLRQASAARGQTLSEFIRAAAAQWIANEDPYYWPTMEAWEAMTPELKRAEAERLFAIAESREAPRCPSMQPVADKYGCGAEWHTMCDERAAAANAATYAAWELFDPCQLLEWLVKT